MQIPILIERIADNGFRARGIEPFGGVAEGATRDEALQNLRKLLEERLAQGAEIVGLEVTGERHPWKPFAGMFKDDPLFDEWQQAIAKYRRRVSTRG
jgi:predicted RNase H-like HicB family nuclease